MSDHPRTRLRNMPLVWDTAIAILLMIGLIMTVGGMRFLHLQPDASALARFIAGFTGLLGFIGTVITTYGSFVEPKRINLYKKSIQLPIDTPLRMAVVGDFHTGPYKGHAFMEKAVRRINDLDADIIVLVGDYIFNHASPLSDLEPLKNLRARHGVFGIIGNHDAGMYLDHGEWRRMAINRSDEIKRTLDSWGIRMLVNDAVTIEHGNDRIRLSGIDELMTGRADLDAVLKDAGEMPTVLLSHTPDVILDPKSHAAHLIISGHTHGGQIRLPFVGPLAPIPDELGRKYDRGIFRITDRTTLFITHGIGETMTRARLFCPPEIVLLVASGKR